MTQWPTVALVGWIVLILVAERLAPAEARPRDNLARIGRNLVLALLALAVAPGLLWMAGSLGATSGGVLPLDRWLGATATLLVSLLMLDLWTYGLHRAYHRVAWMWRLHAPHHLDQHLDVTSAFRFHVFEIVWSGVLRLIPALAFGITAPTLLLFETLLIASAVFHHSNLRLPRIVEQTLGWVVVTPSMHRMHHHRHQRDTDSNYTAILSVWDGLFGSHNPRRWEVGMEIGIEGEDERSLPSLLRYPLSRATMR